MALPRVTTVPVPPSPPRAQLFDSRVTDLTKQLEQAERGKAEDVAGLESALQAQRASQQELLNQIQVRRTRVYARAAELGAWVTWLGGT